MLEFLLKCLCCVTGAAMRVDNSARAAEAHGCCLPIKCFLEIKDCYDHCNSQVGVDNDANSVQMSGATPPVQESMS